MQNPSWIKKDGNDLLINIQVKTRHFSNKIEFNEEFLVIRLKEAPIKGKANKEIIKLLRKLCKTEIIFESGFKASNKIIRLKDISIEEFMLAMTTFILELYPKNKKS